MSTFFLDKQEKFWDDVYKNEVNIKVLNNKYQITDSQLRENYITFIKIKLKIKKAILIGLIAGITGLTIGYKVPKDKNVVT